jgi:putative ABC transport system permease protein
MRFSDEFVLAIITIRGQKLRTAITVAIIAFGIMALIGIVTAIDAMTQKLTESFSTMGASGFSIRYRGRNMHLGGDRPTLKVSRKDNRQERISNLDKPITREQAEEFIRNYHFTASVGLSSFGGNRNEVSFQKTTTHPTVMLFGVDENYLNLNGLSLLSGRNFSGQEIQSAAKVCLLGYDIAHKFFGDDPSLVTNKMVRINNDYYRVLGVLAGRGSTMGFSRDNLVVIPYKIPVGTGKNSFSLGVKAQNFYQLENAIGEAEGTFRSIRKLSATESNNFVIDRSDALTERAMKSLGYLTLSVTLIGLITLIGAAIGLMNIMLVSVTERTKEVGLVKALGGKASNVRNQFLLEALLISISGALVGIFLGILVGNLFAFLLQTSLVIPWNWVIYGIFICTLVGLLAGIYPALKAGKLNPIDALRYE